MACQPAVASSSTLLRARLAQSVLLFCLLCLLSPGISDTQLPLANEPAHSHLLDKIRSMGEKAQKKEQGRAGEVSAPQPVKRKLII
jgi:hypothetical protein